MDEQKLRDEVAERVAKFYAPARQSLASKHAQDAALTDDEWWGRYIESAAQHSPQLVERMTARKEEIIHGRRMMQSLYSTSNQEEMDKRRVDDLLPRLLAIRQRLGAEGPITDEQFHMASIDESQGSISEMLSKIEAATLSEQNPVRQRFLGRFAEMVKADITDMSTLSDPSVNEAQLAEITNKISARMKVLSESPKREP